MKRVNGYVYERPNCLRLVGCSYCCYCGCWLHVLLWKFEIFVLLGFVLSSRMKRVDGYGCNCPNCLRLMGCSFFVCVWLLASFIGMEVQFFHSFVLSSEMKRVNVEELVFFFLLFLGSCISMEVQNLYNLGKKYQSFVFLSILVCLIFLNASGLILVELLLVSDEIVLKLDLQVALMLIDGSRTLFVSYNCSYAYLGRFIDASQTEMSLCSYDLGWVSQLCTNLCYMV